MKQKMKQKSEKQHLLQLTKETPEARRKRVSGGVRLRAAVFQDKRRRELACRRKPEQPRWADE